MPKTDGGCGWGTAQTWVSPATDAGMPPIRTLATPGPESVPPWLLGSPTRAAAGTSVDPDHGAVDRDGAVRLQAQRPGGVDVDGGCVQLDRPGLRAQLDLPDLALDADLAARGVDELDLVAALALQRQALDPLEVVERDPVSALALQLPPLGQRRRQRRPVLVAPE